MFELYAQEKNSLALVLNIALFGPHYVLQAIVTYGGTRWYRVGHANGLQTYCRALAYPTHQEKQRITAYNGRMRALFEFIKRVDVRYPAMVGPDTWVFCVFPKVFCRLGKVSYYLEL